MTNFCEPHLERQGVKIPATRVIAGTPMCDECFGVDDDVCIQKSPSVGLRVTLFAGHRGIIARQSPRLSGPNPTGLCMCGCGNPAPVATETDASKGWVKGQPVRYIRYHGNHARRGMRYEPHSPEWRWTRTRHCA